MTKHTSRAQKLRMAQRAITLQVLRDDHPDPWTRAELEAETSDLNREVVREAMGELAAVGVVIVHADDQHVEASQCARHLDTLDLISI